MNINKTEEEKDPRYAIDDKMIEIFNKINKDNDFITNKEDLNTNLKPKCAYPAPYVRHIPKDLECFYCTCGKSKIQPFCDGESHKDTGFKPMKFSNDKGNKYTAICGCKHNSTQSGPYCDGSHVDALW